MLEGPLKASRFGLNLPHQDAFWYLWCMNHTKRPGVHHESWFPLYARGSSRGKFSRSIGPDRSAANASAASVETSATLGGDHRSHDTSLARTWQNGRWWTGFALECLLICALGGVDADQARRFAPDGSRLGRECGGTCLYWTSPRHQGPDSRSLQHCSSLFGLGQSGYRGGDALGDPASASLWLCRRGGDVVRHHGAGIADWLSQRTGHSQRAGAALWPRLDTAPKTWHSGPQSAFGTGGNDFAFRQRTPSFYQGSRRKTHGADPDIDRSRRLV